jgi:hypothetical protein
MCVKKLCCAFAVAFLVMALPGPACAANTAHTWQSIGPSSITGLDYGVAAGRVRDITVLDDGTVYIATAGGGIWRRRLPDDKGWVPVDDNLPTLAFGSIDHAGTTLYAASGEDASCYDCAWGSGVFVSRLGKSWSRLTNAPIMQSSLVRVESHDGKTILWLVGNAGLYKSEDSGLSWTQLSREPNPGDKNVECDPEATQPSRAPTSPLPAGQVGFCDPRGLAMIPADHVVIVGDTRGLYRSTNDGATWTHLDVNPIRDLQASYLATGTSSSLAVAPGPPEHSVVVAGFSVANTNYDYGCIAGFYISDDSGKNWVPLRPFDYFNPVNSYEHEPGSPKGCQGWYDNAVGINPQNPKEIVVGGITLERSTDGGKAWEPLGKNIALHPDLHALAYYKDSLLIATDAAWSSFRPTGRRFL